MVNKDEVEVGPRWEVVGPFPSGMREHPLLASPLHAFSAQQKHNHDRNGLKTQPWLSDRLGDQAPRTHVPAPPPYADPDVGFARQPFGQACLGGSSHLREVPSELPTGGKAFWSGFDAEEDGTVNIQYPDVNWKQLRADHGWASLQFSVVMRSCVTIPDVGKKWTNVKIDSLQAVEYAFIPEDEEPELPVTWYNGDVYAFGASPSGSKGTDDHASNLSRSLALRPGCYILLVRAIYECRMFGDPHDKPPVIKVRMRVFMDRTKEHSVNEKAALWPDALDGELVGTWGSVPVSIPPDGEATTVHVIPRMVGQIHVSGEPTVIQPGQTRCVAVRIQQVGPIFQAAVPISLVLMRRGGMTEHEIIATFAMKARDGQPVRMTFLSPSTNSAPALVSSATVLPPLEDSDPKKDLPPVLLALHGAGVDVEEPGWIEAIPRLPGMWALLPSGRTEWGEDWHGGSLLDVWAARDTLNLLLPGISKETLLIGHSNGGQGVWHSAARYPDRIRGMIAVAGYLKIQDYVPYTSATSAHYADPALMGILMASLAPYNNDLYASNLVSVPVLAVHGAEDDNVPPRHGRAHAGLVASWSHSGAWVKFVEVPNVGHVWDGVLRHPAILDFIKNLPKQRSTDEVRERGFTLATANPDESGSKAGIRIVELITPGRLARLDVNAPQWGLSGKLEMHSTNVKRIEISGWNEKDVAVLEKNGRDWAEVTAPTEARRYGPMIRLLASKGPLAIVAGKDPRLQCLARRYAHDVRVYHRLDSVILSEKHALDAVAHDELPGNIVTLGRPEENAFSAYLVARDGVPLTFPAKSIFAINGRTVWEEGTGVISLLPHPSDHPYGRGLAAIVAGNDALGLELAARLLPLRTGVPVPDWAVVSPRCQWQAAGGLVGAGFWDAQWKWSESMCWMDRE